MRTSSFFYTGAGRISIARFAPRSTLAGYRIFKPLAPAPWFKSVSEEEYRKLNFAQLGQLDPRKIWEDLHAMHPGVEPVLLCWEDPHDLECDKIFCHRRMVAEWLRTTVGQAVEELPVRLAQ